VDRLGVSHFTHQDHVRILAQRGAEGAVKFVRVQPQFALVDGAEFVGVDEFDRVLDRDDVILVLLVDVLDHRGQRRRFSGAGRSGDDHQPVGMIAEVFQGIGQAHLFDRRNFQRHESHHRADQAALNEGIDAEAGVAGNFVREVGFHFLQENAHAFGAHQARHRGLHVFGGDFRIAGLRNEIAGDAEERRAASFDVQVGALILAQLNE